MLTMRDARNPKTWSGTPYFLSQSLENSGVFLDYIGPLDTQVIRALRGWGKLRRRFGMGGTLGNQSFIAAEIAVRKIQKNLKQRDLSPEVLFSPAGSTLISRLETDIPIAYSSDATFRLILNYYPEYSNLSSSAINQADTLEREAIARADVLLYPTRWVAESAIKDYGADPEKIKVQPYGANLVRPPRREDVLKPRIAGPLHLLFVGVHWTRKGGDIALAALHSLRSRGIEAIMTVIGCTPPDGSDLRGVTVIPFLDKNDSLQLEKLNECYMSADFFLLPTRSECFGIVFCEASAYGLPSITTATGGVPDVVEDGVNGVCLSLEADGPSYADCIEELLNDPKAFDALRVSSRDAYENRLNWEAWGNLAASQFSRLAKSSSL